MNPKKQRSESHFRGQRGARRWVQSRSKSGRGSLLSDPEQGVYGTGHRWTREHKACWITRGLKEQETGRKKAQQSQNTAQKERPSEGGWQAVPAGGPSRSGSASQPRAFRTAEWNSLWGDSRECAGLSWPDARPDSVPRLGMMEGGGAAVGSSCAEVTSGTPPAEVWTPSGAEADSSTCAKCNTTVSLLTCGGRRWAAGGMCRVKCHSH